MGNHDNFQETYKKKRINAFRRILWIWNKNTPQDVINQKTIDFAKRGRFLKNIELDDAQCNDPEFMKTLFSANPKTLDFVKPSAGLEKNIDFMVDYFKMYFEYYFQNKPHITKKLSNLPLINKYSNLMKTPKFVSKIIYVFHENNIVEAIHESVIGNTKTTNSQKEFELHKAMKNIPLWILLVDARRFGVEALKFIPKTHSEFVKIVEAGIACDGFESLEYLPAKFIPDNIYLIKKAFHTVTPYAVSADARKKRLFNYIESTLKNGKLVACGTGRAVVDTNQDKARARNAVLSDPEIQRLYADEYERRGRYAAEMLGSNFEESDFIKFIN